MGDKRERKPPTSPLKELVRRLSSEEILCAIEGRKADELIGYIETRACDPWPDALWPAANEVLTIIARELREQVKLDHSYRLAPDETGIVPNTVEDSARCHECGRLPKEGNCWACKPEKAGK